MTTVRGLLFRDVDLSRLRTSAMAVVATIVPPAWIAWTVAREGLNVPFLDDWSLIPLLEHAHTGHLQLGDFWAQHNEHRPVLARVVLLVLARLTGWDIRWELAANITVALVTLGALGVLVRRTVGRIAPALTPWLVVLTSMLTFSLVQWQNWLWGWQLQVFMNALATVVTVRFLVRDERREPRPVWALVAATIGVLSFASGLALLAIVPIGLALDAMTLRSEGRAGSAGARLGRVWLTALAGAVIGIAYVIGLEHPSNSPSALAALEHPLAFVEFVLAYLGAPLASGLYVTGLGGGVVVLVNALVGMAGIAIVAGGGTWLLRSWPATSHALMPWLLLALYAIMSGAMTGVGRLGSGLNQALMSRYTTISTFFWISAAVVAGLAMAQARRDAAAAATSARIMRAVTIVCCVIAAAGYVMSWAFGAHLTDVFLANVRRGGECVRFHRMAPDPCLSLLNPELERLRNDITRLEALGLSLFAPGTQERPLTSYTIADAPVPAGRVERIDVDRGATEFIVSGWGMDPANGHPAAAILIVVEGNVLGRAPTGMSAGWTFRFGTFRLGTGRHTLEAYALLDRDRIAKLGGSRVIEVGAHSSGALRQPPA